MIRFFRKTSLTALTDEQLMCRVGERQDEKAFNELYSRHARRLMGFFLRAFRYNEDEAADACQETFLKVWQAAEQFNPTSAFRPWLYTIAYNFCRSRFRRSEQVERYVAEQLAVTAEAYDDCNELQLDNATLLKTLSAVLETLPQESRTLFALRFEEELGITQVAQILGIPEGTVKSRLHRLLNYLKQQLHDYE
ncbi:MAG: sigma-70 family RNA polymerase sigma factor [Bacteroidaceae bacterium]|nr:sigma-70 family RNA polymerase sigma factor [Bacteroidaceae bacterium]